MAIGLRAAPDPAHSPRLRIVRVRFVGANAHAESRGEGLLPSKSNYFLGANASHSITDVPNYARVRFDEIYPSIGLVYYGNQGQLEYDLLVRPGGDTRAVRLAINGADRIRVQPNGDLHLSVGATAAVLKRPVVYQEYGGERHPVEAWFERCGRNEVMIRTGRYDHQHTLTIDPVLTYGSYLGGSNDEYGEAIAVDGSGNAYLTGYTYSTDFPLLGSYQSSFGHAALIAYVTKLNPSGTGLVYSTYLGDVKTNGANTRAFGIAVDASGNAYVTGTTTSGFPTTSGAYQTSGTSFVAKLAAAGNALVYSTLIQGATPAAIAVDSSGDAYVTGAAWNTYQTTSGAYQTADKATGTYGTNAFILKLNATGTAAVYSTFLGGSFADTSLGSDGDQGAGIAVDSLGNAYVGGTAKSTDFPVTANAYQSGSGSYAKGFITKLNPQGSALVYSARLGGSRGDNVTGVALDASGSVYATGVTGSSDFPLTSSAFKTTMGPDGSGFVTKLSPDGHSLVYSSLLADLNVLGALVHGIAVDSGGRAFIAGDISPAPGMTLPGDLLPGEPSNADAFYVAKISALGDAVLYATHLGWSPGSTFAIAVDKNGDAYATGTAYFADGYFTDTFLLSTGAFQTTHSSSDIRDAVAIKLTTGSPLIASLSTSATTIDTGQSITATATVGYAPGGSGGSLTGSVIIYDGLTQLTSVPLSGGTATTTLTLPVGIHSLAAVYRNNGAEAVSSTTYLEVNPPASCP